MTDLRQAAQQALDAWDSPLWKTGTTAAKIADLRAALEQQAEPVALWQKRHPLRTEGAWENTNEHDAKWWSEKAQGWEIRALYTTPPQRQWVGLTKVQRDDFADAYGSYESVCAIEQALKEKNSD